MLTIKNYGKLFKKRVGDGNWYIKFCREKPYCYTICIDHGWRQSVVVSLSRTPNTSNGKYTLMDDNQNNPLIINVDRNGISDMDKFLKTLDCFTT